MNKNNSAENMSIEYDSVKNNSLLSKRKGGILKQYSREILLAFQRWTSGMAVEFWWNSTAIPSEYCHRFCPNLPHIFENYCNNTTHFFCGKNRNFYGIFVVFWWNSSGILMEFQSKKQCERSYLQNLTGIFVELFIYFLILLYPKRAWKKPCTVGT